MTVSAKRRGAFVQAAFEILIQAGGRLPRKEIERRVQASFELDEFERSPVPGRNRTQFEVALYRAMNPSSFVGWIKRNHGEWILTEKGSDALTAHPRAPELFEASKRLRRAMRQGATAEPEESRLYEGVEMDYSGKDTTLFTREFASVQQLVAAVEQGTLGLPDIQRPFVWSSAKVRDLLDSMYQGFPVGYLLSWANPGGSGSRQIGSGEHGTAHSTALIIDGQQRLTSLYAVMTGKAILDEQFQQRRIHIAFHPLQARFEVADAAIRKSPEWIADIASLFGSGRGSYQVVSEYLGTLKSVRDLTDDQRRIIAANLERLLQLSKYEFGILRISAETDEEQVADIFVRVNSKGQNLKQSDFILTLLSVFWEQGREQLESFSQACVQRPGPGSAPSPFNHHFHPGPDDLLRVGIALGLRRSTTARCVPGVARKGRCHRELLPGSSAAELGRASAGPIQGAGSDPLA